MTYIKKKISSLYIFRLLDFISHPFLFRVNTNNKRTL